MTEKTQPENGEFSLLDLSQDDITNLPTSLRKRVSGAFGPKDQPSGEWLLVGALQPWLVPLLTGAMRTLPRIASARRSEITEQNIENLIDVLLNDTQRTEVDVDLEMDNAQLRADYLTNVRTLTSAEVRAASGLAPKNRSEPASRWKREGRIFAVRRGGVDLYPAFQFADGAPLKAMASILASLPEDLTPWQIAFWFASGNGWLDGETPQDRLNTPDAVVAAARQLENPAVG